MAPQVLRGRMAGLGQIAFLGGGGISGLAAAAGAAAGLNMRWMPQALAAVTEVRFDGWGGVVQDAISK